MRQVLDADLQSINRARIGEPRTTEAPAAWAWAIWITSFRPCTVWG